MNIIFLVISTFLVPRFVSLCIVENGISTNLTNLASIYNGSNCQIIELAECNEINKQIIENEQNVGKRRFKRSGRRGSIGKGLSKITGGLSIRDRKNSLLNNLMQRNEPFLRNRFNPMRVDRQLFSNIPNAPKISPDLRARMTPKQRIGQPSSSPWAFSRELRKKARKMAKNYKYKEKMNQDRFRSPAANDRMFFNPEYFRESQLNQRLELQRGLNTGKLLDRLSASTQQKYGRKYLGRQIPEPTLQAGQIVPQPIHRHSYRRLQIRASPEDLFGLERINEKRRKRRSINEFMAFANLKKEKREFG